jgi:hypothetical protein
MSLKGPTASAIRNAKRNAVGGARKRCRKGKTCSATCIDPREDCLVELPDPVSMATSQVVSLLKSKKVSSGTPSSPTPTVKSPPNIKSSDSVSSSNWEKRGEIYHKGQTKANLSIEQREAIRDYTSETARRFYKIVNSCLRNPSGCPDKDRNWVNQHAKELDSALKILPNNSRGEEFYRMHDAEGRGINLYRALENAKPGQKIKDPGFGSYTYKKSVAENFLPEEDRRILFISRNKNLTPVDIFSSKPEEKEAILPRGTEQTIRSVRKEGEMLIVELD